MVQMFLVILKRIVININMRCIEIKFIKELFVMIMKININMRCIEIVQSVQDMKKVIRININMRCIEIARTATLRLMSGRLTLT